MGKLLRFKKPALILFFTVSAFNALSAPYPATSTSALTAPQNGLFYISQGFNLSNPENLVSVKTDDLKSRVSLEDYAKKWMKDYVQYGFDLLGSRSFKENEARGIVVDVIHRKTKTQLRQGIFLKDQKAVILTCKEEKSKFNTVLESCNQTIRSFSWIK